DPLFEANRVDEERSAPPAADGMPVKGGHGFVWMRPAVNVDRPIGMRPADIENVDALQFGNVDELDAIRREKLTRTTGRLAAGVRLELIQPAIGIHARCPRLKRDCLGVLTRRGKTPLARQPHTFLRRRRTPDP